MHIYKVLACALILCLPLCASSYATDTKEYAHKVWQFLSAVRSGNTEVVQQQLAADKNLATCTDEIWFEKQGAFDMVSGFSNRETPMLAAVKYTPNEKKLAMIDLLLTHGAKVDTPEKFGNYTPLAYAFVRKNKDVAQRLVAAGASVQNALHCIPGKDDIELRQNKDMNAIIEDGLKKEKLRSNL